MYCNYCGKKRSFRESDYSAVLSVYPPVVLCHTHYSVYERISSQLALTYGDGGNDIFVRWLIHLDILPSSVLKVAIVRPLPPWFNNAEIFKDFS